VRRQPGKLKYLSGSESGMGTFIMDLEPEQSAQQLRAVKL
jgi:UDPglucose--hexose-1-phosphate uridylyltransferase